MSAVDVRAAIHQIVSSMIPLDDIEQEHIRFVRQWLESGCEIFRT